MVPPPPRRASLVYQPLVAANNEIRILVMEPAENDDDEIICSLIHVPLETSSDYTALSYCWGDMKRNVAIRVNDQIMFITPSLKRALTAFRRRRTLRVWADAICINQTDLEERSYQVLRMAAIYRTAVNVIAWLGPCKNETAHQLSRLRRQVDKLLSFSDMFDKFQCRGKQSAMEKDETLFTAAQLRYDPFDDEKRRQHDLARVARGISQLLIKENFNSSVKRSKSYKALKYFQQNLNTPSNWSPLRRVLECEYWSRVWIIQELSMAKSPKVLLGDQTISFSDISFLVACYRILCRAELVKDDDGLESNCRHIQNLHKFEELQSKLKPVPLATALKMASFARSTDPRDKVYGILGLTYTGAIIFPSPSYGRDLWNINVEATMRIIRLEQTLDHVIARFTAPQSWIIDWFDSRTWSHSSLASYFSNTTIFKKKHWGYTDRVQIRQTVPQVSLSGRNLVVEALIIDTIRSCSATYSERNMEPQTSETNENKQDDRNHDSLDMGRFKKSLCRCFSICREEAIPTEKFFYSLGFTMQKASSVKIQNIQNIAKLNKILEWAECPGNSNFRIGSQSLEQWFSPATKSKLTWSTKTKIESASDVVSSIKQVLKLDMRLGETEGNRLGWFTKHARAGDAVARLRGCSVAVVLRDLGDGTYLIVGDCVINGTRAMKENKWEDIKLF